MPSSLTCAAPLRNQHKVADAGHHGSYAIRFYSTRAPVELIEKIGCRRNPAHFAAE